MTSPRSPRVQSGDDLGTHPCTQCGRLVNVINGVVYNHAEGTRHVPLCSDPRSPLPTSEMTPENWTPEMISNFNRTADDMADDTDPVKSAGGEPSGQPIAASPPSLAARKFALPPLADSQEAMEGIGSDGEINSATPPVCPTCHDTRDTDVPCSSAFHIPSLDAPAENVGVVVHGSLMPEESPAARLAIAAANCIAFLVENIPAQSYRKSARQVEAELRDFASKQPQAPTLSEVIEYRREMERLVELRSNPPDAPDTSDAERKRYLEGERLRPASEARPADTGDDPPFPDDFHSNVIIPVVVPTSDSGELERALEKVVTHARALVVSEWASGHASEVQAQLLATARQSVLDLFERLQNRIAELERQSAVDLQMAGEISAARNSIAEENKRLQKENARLQSSNDQYEESLEVRHAEIDSLRSSALTPEEVAGILDFHDTGNDFNPKYQAAIAKLRSLSSLRSSSLGEQTND